jgi:hypothetical protein
MTEAFLGIQVISILFALFMMYLIRSHYKRGNIGFREYVIWNLGWVAFIIFALAPHVLTPLINTLKVARVLDLLIVIAFMILTFVIFIDHIAIRDLYRQIGKLVSDKAKKTTRGK